VDSLQPVGLRDAVRHARVARLSAEAEVQTGSPARWLRGSATPVGDDDSVLLIVRDVTEARRLEAMRRDFVANASHELKTPVASILAAAETIHDAAPDDPAVLQRFGAQLEADAVRLSRIIEDLLDLSRLEGGSDTNDDLALEVIVQDEVDRFDAAARAAGVDLTMTTEPIRVRGSSRDLALMVRNLVDNALRYTPRDGRVDVAMRHGDEEAILEVSDTGIGIPKRDLSRIFERFYRVDQARSRQTGGTGLGLSIVKHVVENHGGTISVESELGGGTRIEVRLPAAIG
jgi:two-component system sensor histidine kinase SenX3